MSGNVYLALSDSRHLDFRTMPNLPAAFSEEGINPLLETNRITAAPLGKLRRILSESVDLALSGGRRLDFRMAPHIPAVSSEEGRNHMLRTHHLTAAPLGNLRARLSGSADLALLYGRHPDFCTMPHLSAAF